MTASLGIVMAGLVILALIGRDAWLRTLTSRRAALTDDAQTTLRAIGERCERIEGTLKVQGDRLLVLERRAPAPKRA